MACNLDVITCNYMHYMSLHATEDANVNCVTVISLTLAVTVTHIWNPVPLDRIGQNGTY